ncbi:signal transduction histidine kinase [Homoserinimonas aerilata]|uniref:Signal transduction histidine kinase n=1 Tax=Homoserinimonas aerilata TaxID=1162970 RepID=A0A542YL25_9MICO|nr:ATP-binding protein [Homoserinimonas aerilata]TQL48761.1 signal transduction histidine kinase [Homoserinimonas aerilata]
MSLGLPSHLVPRALSRSLAKSAHAIALASLLCGTLAVVAFSAARIDLLIWPALVALACMLGALYWVDRSRRPVAAFGYLAVGAVSTYWYVLVFTTQMQTLVEGSILWLALPKVALVMVAGTGAGIIPPLLWTLSGYLLAEFAAAAALLQSGLSVQFDPVTLAALLIAYSVSVLGFVSTSLAHKTQPRLHRAARDELLDDIRARMELRAAALMHDTILSHLAAIASSTSDRLDPVQKTQIEHDLQILIGQEWLNEDLSSATEEALVDWRTLPLNSAILEARRMGLDVIGTGDIAAITRLDRIRNTALGLAVKQCLVNVVKHSGVMKAEVAVYGAPDEISVMVIDAGKGFSDAVIGADRLGLKNSVRRRIEAVGGVVQIWSTPGSGTSILLQLPVAPGAVPAIAPVASAAPAEAARAEAAPANELSVAVESTGEPA